jgi:hypothetical protein
MGLVLKIVCDKRRFLDQFENFILFAERRVVPQRSSRKTASTSA